MHRYSAFCFCAPRKTPRLFVAWMAPLVVLVVPSPAGAFELSGGVGLGGFLAGTAPRLAVSPHV